MKAISKRSQQTYTSCTRFCQTQTAILDCTCTHVVLPSKARNITSCQDTCTRRRVNNLRSESDGVDVLVEDQGQRQREVEHREALGTQRKRQDLDRVPDQQRVRIVVIIGVDQCYTLYVRNDQRREGNLVIISVNKSVRIVHPQARTSSARKPPVSERGSNMEREMYSQNA